MHSPLGDKIEPLVNLSATAALEKMMKATAASAALRGVVKPLVKPAASTSPALAALDGMMKASPATGNDGIGIVKSSPATAALDQMMKASGAIPALDGIMGASPATAALEESLLFSSSKRVKKSSKETPRRASMTSFTRSSTKFDTTDLFQAIEAPDHNEEFTFPSLSWDLDNEEQSEDNGFGETAALSNETNPFESGLGKRKNRRSLSASCLLGKRPRGLVRSKTMKSEVDRLVSQHQAGFPCVLQAAK